MKKKYSIRLDDYQVSTIDRIAKQKNEPFTSTVRRMIDYATNRTNPYSVVVSLDEWQYENLIKAAKRQGKSEGDLAAEMINGCLSFYPGK